jgi:hypothetical protein
MAETADYQFFREVWLQCNASFLKGSIGAFDIGLLPEKNSVTTSRTIP